VRATNQIAINRTVQLTLLLAGVALLTAGCPAIAPHSRAYQPLSQWEAKSAAQARRDVFPNDVRQHPDSFTNTLVAWTGVITNIEYFTNVSPRLVRFTAAHHYFDWIEDSSNQRETFFLSPRGEGGFAAQWVAQTANDQKFVDQFAIGDMLIAYGYPSVISGNYVALNPLQSLRAVKPQWYRTDMLDYGRPGEPSKVLKTAR
jgi:hypothetical protein